MIRPGFRSPTGSRGTDLFTPAPGVAAHPVRSCEDAGPESAADVIAESTSSGRSAASIRARVLFDDPTAMASGFGTCASPRTPVARLPRRSSAPGAGRSSVPPQEGSVPVGPRAVRRAPHLSTAVWPPPSRRSRRRIAPLAWPAPFTLNDPTSIASLPQKMPRPLRPLYRNHPPKTRPRAIMITRLWSCSHRRLPSRKAADR